MFVERTINVALEIDRPRSDVDASPRLVLLTRAGMRGEPAYTNPNPLSLNTIISGAQAHTDEGHTRQEAVARVLTSRISPAIANGAEQTNDSEIVYEELKRQVPTSIARLSPNGDNVLYPTRPTIERVDENLNVILATGGNRSRAHQRASEQIVLTFWEIRDDVQRNRETNALEAIKGIATAPAIEEEHRSAKESDKFTPHPYSKNAATVYTQ